MGKYIRAKLDSYKNGHIRAFFRFQIPTFWPIDLLWTRTTSRIARSMISTFTFLEPIFTIGKMKITTKYLQTQKNQTGNRFPAYLVIYKKLKITCLITVSIALMSAWICLSSSTWAIFSCWSNSISLRYSDKLLDSLSKESTSCNNLSFNFSKLMVLDLKKRRKYSSKNI